MDLGLNGTILTYPILIKIDYTLPMGGWQERRLCIAAPSAGKAQLARRGCVGQGVGGITGRSVKLYLVKLITSIS